MSENQKEINIKFDDFKTPGLYLIFKDGSKLVLTAENIEKVVKEFWDNPAKISSSVKKAIDFQRCSFCPMKSKEDMCDAIRPTIPFLSIVDKYVSFDEVTAVFTGDDGILRVSFTTMQEALKYVSILSLMNFCKKGRTYWKYFYGINPLMNPKEIAGRLCLNLHFINKDYREKIKETITKFNEEITISSKNQIMRMNLVCKNDAFMNSFVNTQLSAMLLSMDMDKKLEAVINEFGETHKKVVVN
jgi:hypothetical protein